MENDCYKGRGALKEDDAKFLELIVVILAQFHEYTKTTGLYTLNW